MSPPLYTHDFLKHVAVMCVAIRHAAGCDFNSYSNLFMMVLVEHVHLQQDYIRGLEDGAINTSIIRINIQNVSLMKSVLKCSFKTLVHYGYGKQFSSSFIVSCAFTVYHIVN